jgi:hypothetical protein
MNRYDTKINQKNKIWLIFLGVQSIGATTCGWKSHIVPDSGELLVNEKRC